MRYAWYPWNVQDYRRDTMHLSLAEDGAYRRLIDEYMTIEGALPNNDAALARLVGTTMDEWLAVAPNVRAFFKPSNDKLVHKRCEQELHAQRMRNARRSQAASVAATARHQRDRENKEIIATSMRNASGSHAFAMRFDATRQDKERKREDGSLATALPTGALREPKGASQPCPASDALSKVIREKGWAR